MIQYPNSGKRSLAVQESLMPVITAVVQGSISTLVNTIFQLPELREEAFTYVGNQIEKEASSLSSKNTPSIHHYQNEDSLTNFSLDAFEKELNLRAPTRLLFKLQQPIQSI